MATEDSLHWQRFLGSSQVAAGSWENVMEKSAKPVCFVYIPALLLCYAVTFFSLRQLTTWRGLKLEKLAGQLSQYPAFFVLIVTSHLAAFDREFWTFDWSVRFHNSDHVADMFANFYIATNIVQGIGQIQTEKPPLLYQVMAHHVLSIACYGSGFYFDRFRWWTTLAGCCEFTNLFLLPVFASKEFFPEWREQLWFLWNSRLLWITFITHRLILFPVWLIWWARDRWMAAQEEEFEDIHWMEGTVYPVTILGLLMLSIIWFIQIDRGLKKQLVVYTEAQKNKKKAA